MEPGNSSQSQNFSRGWTLSWASSIHFTPSQDIIALLVQLMEWQQYL